MSEVVRTRERFKLSSSVFLLFLQGNEILFLLRSNTGWLDDHYSPPGGVKEPGETLPAAAIREATEEVGLTVLPENLMLAHVMHNFTSGQEWIAAFFITEKWSGTPGIKEPHKHSDLKWVHIENLPENTSPYVRQAIEAYLEEMPYSEFGWNIPADSKDEEYDHRHVPRKK
jgi:8-oxo-dGTP pyrophosphatase MutT (NUDIX family)